MSGPQRKSWLLIGALIAMVLLLGDRIVITGLLKLWRERATKIAARTQAIEKGTLLLDRADVLEERWRGLNNDALSSDTAQAENMVLNTVSGWAMAGGLQVTDIKPHWIDDDNLGRRLEIRLSATGNLRAISRFLHDLETDSLPLRLENIGLRTRDDKGGELQLDARFSGLLSAAERESAS